MELDPRSGIPWHKIDENYARHFHLLFNFDELVLPRFGHVVGIFMSQCSPLGFLSGSVVEGAWLCKCFKDMSLLLEMDVMCRAGTMDTVSVIDPHASNQIYIKNIDENPSYVNLRIDESVVACVEVLGNLLANQDDLCFTKSPRDGMTYISANYITDQSRKQFGTFIKCLDLPKTCPEMYENLKAASRESHGPAEMLEMRYLIKSSPEESLKYIEKKWHIIRKQIHILDYFSDFLREVESFVSVYSDAFGKENSFQVQALEGLDFKKHVNWLSENIEQMSAGYENDAFDFYKVYTCGMVGLVVMILDSYLKDIMASTGENLDALRDLACEQGIHNVNVISVVYPDMMKRVNNLYELCGYCRKLTRMMSKTFAWFSSSKIMPLLSEQFAQPEDFSSPQYWNDVLDQVDDDLYQLDDLEENVMAVVRFQIPNNEVSFRYFCSLTKAVSTHEFVQNSMRGALNTLPLYITSEKVQNMKKQLTSLVQTICMDYKLLGSFKSQGYVEVTTPQGATPVSLNALDPEQRRLYYNSMSHVLTTTQVDSVPCFEFKGWPDCAKTWVNRYRQWPDKSLVELIAQSGYHVVPTARTNSQYPEYEWRLSFSRAEIYLAQARNKSQKRAYIVFKSLYYRELSFPQVISSYHCKTVMNWMSERLPSRYWCEKSLGQCVQDLLIELQQCLLKKKCPHYFIPAVNLLDMAPTDHCIYLALKIDDMLRNPLAYPAYSQSAQRKLVDEICLQTLLVEFLLQQWSLTEEGNSSLKSGTESSVCANSLTRKYIDSAISCLQCRVVQKDLAISYIQKALHVLLKEDSKQASPDTNSLPPGYEYVVQDEEVGVEPKRFSQKILDDQSDIIDSMGNGVVGHVGKQASPNTNSLPPGYEYVVQDEEVGVRPEELAEVIHVDQTDITILRYPPAVDSNNQCIVTMKAYASLHEGQFLMDEIMAFYLRYLENEVLPKKVVQMTRIFPIWFTQKLSSAYNTCSRNGDEEIFLSDNAYEEHLADVNAKSGVNIFEKKYCIIIMYDWKRSHWFVAIIRNLHAVMKWHDQFLDIDSLRKKMKERGYKEYLTELASLERHTPSLLIFDSMEKSASEETRYRKEREMIKEYLSKEWAYHHPEQNFRACLDLVILQVPQQRNGADCGLFALHYVERFLEDPWDYSDVTDMKRWFVPECVGNGQKRKEIKSLIQRLKTQSLGQSSTN